jgi:hypothetical protein
MDDPDDPTVAALAWLLASDEPAVRYLARRDLLGEREGDPRAADALDLNPLRVLRAASVTPGGGRARPGSAPPGSTG